MCVSHPGAYNVKGIMQLNPSRRKIASDDAKPHEAIGPDAVASKSSALHRDNAFGRLPMSVARDTRLSAVDLVVLTHRTTFTKGFVPKEHFVQAIVKGGMGKDTVRRAIARLRSEESPQAKRRRKRRGRDIEPKLLGYLHRRQVVDPNGQFIGVREELRLPKCQRPRLVPRSWFDGHLSLNALAALIYIQAGAEGGGQPYLREIAERFGWTRQTAAKAVRKLVTVGLVVEHHDRRQEGRFAGVRYGLKDRQTVDLRCVKKPGNGVTGNGQPGNILRDALYELSSRDSSNKYIRSSYASLERDAATPDFSQADLGSIAVSTPNLLWWAEEQPYGDDLFSIDDDAVQTICAVAGDDELRSLMREATGGRVSWEIMSDAGLEAIRTLAAYVLEWPPYDETFTPHEALDYVLNAIRNRIGNRPKAWLNSLAVIGLRILCPSAGGDGVEDAPYRSQRRRRKAPSPRMTAAFRDIKAADHALVIAPMLYRDAKSLEDLIEEFGPAALDTIRACLADAAINGGEVGKIRTWSYFVPALDDERRAVELRAKGLRPGDCPGWRHSSRKNSDRGATNA